MRTPFPVHFSPNRWLARAALAAGIAALAGCTVTPWTDTWQPYRAPAPSPSASSGVLAGYYRVNPGDTLAGVAAAFGQRVQDVASWNHMAPTDGLSVGQVLRVAPPPAAIPLTPQSAPSLSESLSWPATGTVTAPFVPGRTRGITITASGPDQTVRAAAPGRVVYAGTGVKAYGPLVILKHESGLITAYGHAGSLLVHEGDAVRAGQPVAQMAVDPSGRASFEFEIRQNGKPVDPMGYLPRNGG
ncbi:peptidoglycan DD-metalloendopeptidase family protein [Burkholderia guangdongensis]|uniref:peptidoglycan DD-metalloendopeptidase family protein n=1 Tax=Burkholderia guangdongensis TaxID=1792500 RepID=UPI0015C8C638|nr:peptidoglycan DD-metalloendopeptidase family protein [Burkholderia guangdongensis]